MADNFLNKAMIFDWFANAESETATASLLNSYPICKYASDHLRIIRMTDTGNITVLGWPGSIVVIEHQPTTGTCTCDFRCILYPDPAETKSNRIYNNVCTLWEKWWSAWVFCDSEVKLIMASS